MSLSDYIKYLRAVKGGLTPWEIAEGSGVPARDIHLLEVKHRRMGDDDGSLQKIAVFFDVPVEDLIDRREAYRKRLTEFLHESRESETPVALRLESGMEISGAIQWYSREAVAIAPQDEDSSSPYIVQRGWVSDWRRAGNPDWEIRSGIRGQQAGV